MIRIAWIALLGSACLATPGGQCKEDAQCGYGTTCQRGLCEKPPAAAPRVSWLSPAPGEVHARGAVEIAFAAGGDGFTLQAAGLAGTLNIPLLRGADGVFRGAIDATALPEGGWSLTPLLDGRAAEARLLRIDRSGPSVFVHAPSGVLRRNELARITATVLDDGGVDEGSVLLVSPGATPLPGRRIGAHEFAFELPLSQPTLFAVEGDVALHVQAQDLAGNGGAGEGSVRVTRRLWQSDAGRGLPLRSSPALDGARVYIGSDGGRVAAVDRQTGVTVWAQTLRGPVSASPARGDFIYAASEAGEVEALQPGTGEVAWSCSDPLHRFLASPALMRVDGQEVLLLANASALQLGNTTVQGGVFAFAKSFPGGACAVLGTQGGGQSSVAVAADGTLYVGGLGRALHALRFDGAAFSEQWTASAGDDVTASPALTAAGTVLFGDADGGLQWRSAAGAAQGSFALGEKLLASPVLAFDTGLAQGRDGTLAPVSPPHASSPQTPVYVAQQLPGAGWVSATPAVGADGTVYVSAGRSLRAIAPGGALLWEAPLAGASTASSPALSCDGILYVGDASGTLSALITDSAGLAPGGWPSFRHDSRNTGNSTSPLCD